jgi:hypothetical protein
MAEQLLLQKARNHAWAARCRRTSAGGAAGAPNCGRNRPKNTSSCEISHVSSCLITLPVSLESVYTVFPVYGLNLKSNPACVITPSRRQVSSILLGPVTLQVIKSALALSGLNILATALAYFSVPAEQVQLTLVQIQANA